MKAQAEKKPRSAAPVSLQMQTRDEGKAMLGDKRSNALTQLKIQEIANNDKRTSRGSVIQNMADNFGLQQTIQKKANSTGLPDQLKTGVESLSGVSMDDVKVHYNSTKPAQMQAHAYAQGSEIHLAPQQEKHLPHEAWHVVQQKQGRVQATKQLKTKIAINDNPQLEKEADVMGAKALSSSVQLKENLSKAQQNSVAIQRAVIAAGNRGPLVGASRAKFAEVIAAVNVMGANMLPGQMVPITIEVDNESEPNPAETRLDGLGGIEIGVRKWYIDISSVGEIVGLISHELGVHNLADMLMSQRSQRQEDHRNRNSTGFQVQAGAHQVGVTGWNGPLNARDNGRQRDHVNVVRDSGGRKANASARTQAYATTMLKLGDGIAAGAGTPAQINAKLRDLLQTYLFDYSRILVTDDGGPWATMRRADVIAHVMQWYQTTIFRRYHRDHPWLNRVQVNTGGWGIRGWLLGKLAMYAGNRIMHGLGVAATAVGNFARGAWNRVFG